MPYAIVFAIGVGIVIFGFLLQILWKPKQETDFKFLLFLALTLIGSVLSGAAVAMGTSAMQLVAK